MDGAVSISNKRVISASNQKTCSQPSEVFQSLGLVTIKCARQGDSFAVAYSHRQEDHLPPDYYARFFSPSRGFLALLIDDSAEDLCQPDFVIPHGDFNTPYDDLDQGWNMLIVEDHAFVYIITGNWEVGEAQRTWFKVERSLYYCQWEKTIQRCRALCRSQT